MQQPGPDRPLTRDESIIHMSRSQEFLDFITIYAAARLAKIGLGMELSPEAQWIDTGKQAPSRN